MLGLFQDVKDDYIFECEAGNPYQKTKLTILQSLGDRSNNEPKLFLKKEKY